MYVIGTAGHVDHGKSSLVRALTGIDPDRLKEEKAREMTIDLGFAWLTLPEFSAPIGIIDVPGHRDFIENMLAGVGGIHLALFVVAADEGVMPQTREHLAILDLLQIPKGIIALSKTDLVNDPDWLDLVQLDLAEVTHGTILQDAPVIPVSARTGAGVDTLKAAIGTALAAITPAVDHGTPRLWVDRVFTVSGFGTVVTGTLLDGALAVGQEVELQSGGLRGRVRGLQSHHQPVERVEPGSRAAINLAGVEKNAVRRGHLLTLPNAVSTSILVVARFRHLPDAPRPLKHQAEVKLFCGSAETVARVRLLDAEILPPGAEGWLQLELREPLPLSRGDRFILRYPSPGITIGGGMIVEAGSGARWRRNDVRVLTRLEALASGDSRQLILATLAAARSPLTAQQIAVQSKLTEAVVTATLPTLADAEPLIISGKHYITAEVLDSLLMRFTRVLTDLHQAEPLRIGFRAEKLCASLHLDAPEFEVIAEIAVARELIFVPAKGSYALAGHSVRWTRAQQVSIDKLRAKFETTPNTPPSYKEAAAVVGDDVLTALIELGEIRQIAPDVLLTPAVYAEWMSEARRALETDGRITVKAFRDRFDTSRKYALAALEHLNALGITKRDGDNHVLASGDWTRVLPSSPDPFSRTRQKGS